MAVADVKRSVIAAIDAAAEELIGLSKFIHDHPEVALQEFKSSAACADLLERYGFRLTHGIAGLETAFRADAQGTGPGPRVAFLSEYDALPGIGHGCGHNLIALAGVGAGAGLKAALGEMPGHVTVFGAPAEEAIGGKVIMADVGAFANVDAAVGAHPGTVEASCPTVEGSGKALACQEVRIEFAGRPAHAAADPFHGINALNALIETFNGINALRQHVKSDARFHGIITHGGDAPNIVPAYAAGEFYVRAATVAYMNELLEQVRKIAEGAALVTGAELTFTLVARPNSDMITNYALPRRLKHRLDEVGLSMPEAKAEEGTGSTDWGNVSYVVPSVETSYPILDQVCTWHSQEVVEAADSDLGYRNTLLAAKAMALTGLDLLTDPALLSEVRGEFERSQAARAA